MDHNTAHTTQTPQTADTLGAVIRQAREWAGLSLRNLAAITGIPRMTLNHLERDEIDRPNPKLLYTLAEALELHSDDLFALVGYRPSTSLPSLVPYLRAKYRLPPDAMTEATAALQEILAKYDPTPTEAPTYTAQQHNNGTLDT